jgi:hypothetical protein
MEAPEWQRVETGGDIGFDDCAGLGTGCFNGQLRA